MELSKHPWRHRIEAAREYDYSDFVGNWLHDIEKIDVTAPVLSITNGWGARHRENQWWADEFFPNLAVYAYDSRGQGESPKHGDLDAIAGAIDADYLITRAFDQIDAKAKNEKKEVGNKIIQGNCVGAMTAAALFAGRFPVSRRADGVILISPVSTFNLPTIAKISYFLPAWLARWAVRYVAEPAAKMMVSGEDSEFSRKKALERLYSLDVDAGLRQAKQIFWKENVKKLWKEIDVPTLMIVSPADPLTRIEESAEVFHELRYPIWLELEAPDHLILEDNIDFLREFVPRFARDPWGVYEEYKDTVPKYSQD